MIHFDPFLLGSDTVSWGTCSCSMSRRTAVQWWAAWSWRWRH